MQSLLEWSYVTFNAFYDGVLLALESTFEAPTALPADIPAPTVAIVVAVCLLRGGVRLAILSTVLVALTLAFGLWNEPVDTMVLMVIAVGIGAGLGLVLGVVAARVRGLRGATLALLDAMQTFPVFAYLVPAIFIFGPGTGAALVLSTAWCLPPMARLTIGGLTTLDRVPSRRPPPRERRVGSG